jgi:transposase-like protein
MDGDKQRPKMLCRECGSHFVLKNNISIIRERDRISRCYNHVDYVSCPNPNCENHFRPIESNKDVYQKFGYTSKKLPRIKCKICGKTFTNAKRNRNHKVSHLNFIILKLLLNQSAINRICEIASVSPKTVYDKIDFFERQFLSFVSEREQNFTNKKRIYVGTDQQYYTINWEKRHDKRNVILKSISTSDNESGYCFGIHVNLDERLSQDELEGLSLAAGDNLKPAAYRLYANYITEEDYLQKVKRAWRKEYGDLEFDNGDGELFTNSRLPYRGVQTHAEYNAYGHLLLMKKIFRNVEKIRITLDNDGELRPACLAVFADRIIDRTCDVFTISVNNKFTIDQREIINRKSIMLINSVRKKFNLRSSHEAMVFLLSKVISVVHARNCLAADKVVKFPFAHNGELIKYATYETNFDDYDLDHLANLYLKASIHRTNNFFQQVRRRIRLLERPMTTVGDRVWSGYSPYNPQIVQKMLNILRVYHNYCLPGNDKLTPAFKLGLAKGVVRLDDILYCA